MQFPLNVHYDHFLDEMPENKSEGKDAESLWQRRQKLKLRLISVAIIATFAAMVYLAMLLLSSLASSETSPASLSIDIESNMKTPVLSPIRISTETSTSPSDTPSYTPSDHSSQLPSKFPSPHPTSRPSLEASTIPSLYPTIAPTSAPTFFFSSQPTDRSASRPTIPPTNRPTHEPTPLPTSQPTDRPTNRPTTRRPSEIPSPRPTDRSTNRPTTRRPSEPPSPHPSIEKIATIEQTATPSEPPEQRTEFLETNFVVIGDIPYNKDEEAILREHIKEMPDDMEFLIHVGDIRNGADRADCTLEEFQNVADILLKSRIPVFIVPGDNEYNDCPNFEESFANWLAVFGKFENNWRLPFVVSRDQKRPENFYFVHKQVLYVGLNIVGGDVVDIEEWENRLEHNFQWTKMLVDTFVVQPGASTVVIIGHADPRQKSHATFFGQLGAYMASELSNKVPFLYINGDRHYFQYDEWMPNFHRIMVEGGRKEPPLQMMVSIPQASKNDALRVEDIYTYQRYPM